MTTTDQGRDEVVTAAMSWAFRQGQTETARLLDACRALCGANPATKDLASSIGPEPMAAPSGLTRGKLLDMYDQLMPKDQTMVRELILRLTKREVEKGAERGLRAVQGVGTCGGFVPAMQASKQTDDVCSPARFNR